MGAHTIEEKLYALTRSVEVAREMLKEGPDAIVAAFALLHGRLEKLREAICETERGVLDIDEQPWPASQLPEPTDYIPF